MLKNGALIAIKIYKKLISPFLRKSCRYYPSCSSYAIVAVDKHGLLKGGLIALARITKCNQFTSGGYDPVP